MTTRKIITGCAALFRVACGIYRNPAQAYAYALLCRLGCPRAMLQSVPLTCSDDKKMWLFDVLSRLNYDVYAFVDVISKLLQERVLKTTGNVVEWGISPDVVAVIQVKECAVLKNFIEKLDVCAEDACLYIMLSVQPLPDDHTPGAQSIRLLTIIDGLYETRYNENAYNPLTDLRTTATKMLSIDID